MKLVKTFIWKIRYTLAIRKIICVPLRIGWDMAGSAVEFLGDDIFDCSPQEAAESEADEWIQSM